MHTKRRSTTSARNAAREGWSAFTLIELLTVVAIIGVLAALLLVGLAQAKGSAKRVQCVSNLRQLGIGLQGFVADHHAYPLVVNFDFSKGEHPEHWRSWVEALSREGFGSKSNGMSIAAGAWLCPSGVVDVSTNGPAASYSYNAWGLGSWGLGGNRVSGAATLAPPIGESEVADPGDMIAIGDSFNGSIDFKRTDVNTQRASSRHQGKVNVLFCDGHVESAKLKSVFEDTSDAALARWNRDHQPHRERL